MFDSGRAEQLCDRDAGTVVLSILCDECVALLGPEWTGKQGLFCINSLLQVMAAPWVIPEVLFFP